MLTKRYLNTSDGLRDDDVDKEDNGCHWQQNDHDDKGVCCA